MVRKTLGHHQNQTFTGEVSGYYDYKRATEGVDPVTGEKLTDAQRIAAGAMASRLSNP